MSRPSVESYFVRTGHRTWAATEHTGGGWSTTEQHISPMLGLLTHVVESERPDDDGKAVARITFDILGAVALEEVEVHVDVVRAGRTIELVEAAATWRGRSVVRARAWRLALADTASVAGGAGDPIPRPDEVSAWDMTSLWPGGYIASLDVRRRPDASPGRATAWVSTPVRLVDDEPVSDTARFVGLVDTANGIGVLADPQQWLFPNVDLSIHLHRAPVGPWVGLDTTVVLGPEGLGVTSTALHDVHGAVGRAEQVLTLRPRP